MWRHGRSHIAGDQVLDTWEWVLWFGFLATPYERKSYLGVPDSNPKPPGPKPPIYQWIILLLGIGGWDYITPQTKARTIPGWFCGRNTANWVSICYHLLPKPEKSVDTPTDLGSISRWWFPNPFKKKSSWIISPAKGSFLNVWNHHPDIFVWGGQKPKTRNTRGENGWKKRIWWFGYTWIVEDHV